MDIGTVFDRFLCICFMLFILFAIFLFLPDIVLAIKDTIEQLRVILNKD